MEKLIKRLEEADNICLISHVHPDGDAVGSVIALYLFLKKKGKNVKPFLKSGVPHQYNFVPHQTEILTQEPVWKEFELCVLLDASEFERTGFETPNIPIVRIDHHKTGKKYSEVDLVVPEAPATASLVLKVLRTWDEASIDKEIIRALYTALITDTVCFIHANSLIWALEDALYLARKGNVEDIGSLSFERKSKAHYRLLQKALARLRFKYAEKLAYSWIEFDDFADANASAEDTDGIIRHLIAMEGVDVAVCFFEYERDDWKISTRGKGKVDLSKVCFALGGGGHRDAAGCSINGKREQVISKFFEKFEENVPDFCKS